MSDRSSRSRQALFILVLGLMLLALASHIMPDPGQAMTKLKTVVLLAVAGCGLACLLAALFLVVRSMFLARGLKG